MKFWDASALVPLAVNAPPSGAVRSVLASDPDVTIWWMAPVECASAVARRSREGSLDDGQEAAARRVLDRLFQVSEEVQPSQRLREQAMRMVRVHALRSADALQLAAALAWADGAPSARGFVCLDERLRDAARREGFEVLPG